MTMLRHVFESPIQQEIRFPKVDCRIESHQHEDEMSGEGNAKNRKRRKRKRKRKRKPYDR